MGSACSRRAPGPRTPDEQPGEGERVVWQWCRSPEKVARGEPLTDSDWGEYETENSEHIESALQEGRSEVQVYVGARPLVIKLNAMAEGFNFPRVQWCPNTQNRRGVRRILARVSDQLPREPSNLRAEDDVCAICTGPLNDPHKRSCKLECSPDHKHTFHVVCLSLLPTLAGGTRIKCPICCRKVPRPDGCASLRRQMKDNLRNRNLEADNVLLVNADRGCVDLVRAALESGANVNMQMAGGTTPLMAAAVKGHIDAVRALLTSGAEVDTLDSHGKTALWHAGHQGHIEVIRHLLQNGASADVFAHGWRARDLPCVKHVLQS